MTTNHHSPLPYGGRLTSADMEAPLGQLDSAIAATIATGSGASTSLTAQALSGQKNMVVADRTGWAVGDVFWIGFAGATYESGVIASGTGAGAGTLVAVANLANTYASGVPVSKSPVELVNARGTYANLGGRITAIANRVYDVKQYGAVGNGSTDDTAAIEAASVALSAAGGGILYVPPGTYIVDWFVIPGWAGYYAGVIVRSGCMLVGAGMGASTIKLKANASSFSSAGIVRNSDMDGGDERVGIMDITVDGNGANQTTLYQGVDWVNVRGARHSRVRVLNVRGTSNFPPGESMHFNAYGSTDIFYTDCEVIGTAGTHGSGFGTNYCTNITRVNCISHGMTAGMGIADYRSRGIRMVNCLAQQNGTNGFNIELSQDIELIGCVAGGRAAEGTGHYWGADQPLGNTGDGIVINGSTQVNVIGCSGRYNAGYGLDVVGTSQCQVIGGYYANNTNYGIRFGEVASARLSSISAETVMENNTIGDLYINGGAGAIANAGSTLPAPAIPASTVVYTHDFPFDISFYLAGGTVTFVLIDGAVMGLVGGHFRVKRGGTIQLNYSVAPTWIWSRR